MARNEMTIKVGVKLEVSKETADAALAIVAMYVNDTGKDIIGRRLEDGTVSFEYIERIGTDGVKMEGITEADISKLKVDQLDPELMEKKIPKYTINSGGDSYLAHFK